MPEAARIQPGIPAPRAFARLAARVGNRLIRATPRHRIDVPTHEPVVSFTFDDVPDTAATVGAAILEAYGARGTFYVAGGLLGRVEPGRSLLDAQGCRALAARGHEIGCHSYAHRLCSTLSPRALAADLARNAAILDALAPRPGRRRNYAFPFNAGTLRGRALMERTYRSCRAAGEAINRGAVDPCFLAGVEIAQPEARAAAVAAKLDDLLRRPGWLILVAHDVAEKPTPHGCRPDSFEALVRRAAEGGCRILTVDAALDRFGLRR